MPDYSSIGGAAGGLIGGPIGAGIGSLAGAALGFLTGGSQKRKGRALTNEQYPDYNIPQSVTDAANQGLPSEQYQQAMRNIQRQQMATIAQAQDRRSGLAAIGMAQQHTNDALLNLDSANAQARQKNQRILAGYQDKQWQNNVKNKYDRDYNYGMQLLGAGNQNTSNAIDKAGAGIGYILGGNPFSGYGSSSGGNTGQRLPNADVETLPYRADSSYTRGYMV